jgi:GNAT superfamily N-acetyltransferase
VGDPLDNPAWSALTGPQAGLAVRRGRAARFALDVSPFAAVADGSVGAWEDLAALVGPGGTVMVPDGPAEAPPGWEPTIAIPGVQMDGAGLDAAHDAGAEVLGPSDVPEMLDLVARTRPGPFLPRTIALGAYLGIRRDEISAVCTDPAYRGQGLAGRLVRAVGAVVRERGDVPFLHAAAANATGIRLYERLGFAHRRDILFAGFRVPAAVPALPG